MNLYSVVSISNSEFNVVDGGLNFLTIVFLAFQLAGSSMIWQCKLCSTSVSSRPQLFKHYRLQHSHFPRVSPLYNDCMCTFQSLNAMRTHLSRTHTAQLSSSAESGDCVI